MTVDENKPTDVHSLAEMAAAHAGSTGGVRLMVVIGDEVHTRSLPASGTLSIGRLKDSDIQIPISTVSRKHADLIMGQTIYIQDCGSLNGVSVRGRKLSPGEKIVFLPGEIVELGDAMLVIQRRSTARLPREVVDRAAFDQRLERACRDAERDGASFGVMLVAAFEEVPPGTVEDAFDLCLPADDLVAHRGPGRFACLLPQRSPEEVEALCRRFIESLDRHQTAVRTGVACYPRDALTADLLMDKARAVMSGEPIPAEASDIVLEDEHMQRLRRLVERIAPGNINVMIQGETGVGKEVVARMLHRYSGRPEHLFVSVNCAALPQSLLESELFGHERGAFTGADKAKPGLLEIAENGTFLLDEVSEMPPLVQAKLLRMLEERQAVRVGGLKPYDIAARFVATTNRKLEEAVEQGVFREDLYYRLEGILLKIPPLRERPAEIEPLAASFIRQTCAQMGRTPLPLMDEEALGWMRTYHWPGNVRELRNVVERAVLLSSGDRITRHDVATGSLHGPAVAPAPQRPVPPPLPGARSRAGEDTGDQAPRGRRPDPLERVPTRRNLPVFEPDPERKLKDEMKQLEYHRILDALNRSGGNQTKAAKLLGISRRTLINRLDEFGIERPRKGKK